ncbi:hypothetical protein DFH11DRAFT_1583145 [Phellopilus nigrolimitatus]|nr:hypothetical protein DFH11DRAFT_1583145 [Phellopilus nigrolimitatus]
MKLFTILPTHFLLLILNLLDEGLHAQALESPPIIHTHLERANTYTPYLNHGSKTKRSANVTHDDDENIKMDEDVVCYPAGACEPCPEDLLQEPFCQPFGNRRLLHCLAVPPSYDTLSPSKLIQEGKDTSSSTSSPHPPERPPQSSLPAWESCGRRVPKERADFFEFVLCNVIFAALALAGVLIRSERMRAVRARRLAARIGVGLRRASHRASSGNWRMMGGMGAALVPAESIEEEGLVSQDA